MSTITNQQALSNVQDTFLDSRGLEAVRSMGRNDDPAALKEMAKQFESLFVQQMMKSMRAAGDVFAEGNYMRSSDTEFYQQMLDQQMSLELTKGRGLGLGDTLYQQMMRSYSEHFEQPNSDEPEQDTERNGVLRVSNEVTAAPVSDNSDTEPAILGFVEKMKPYAQWAANKLGVNPAALVAQAALETGWGKSIAETSDGVSSNNVFNIKATGGWSGDKLAVNTTEYIDGDAESVQADFRQYRSLFESFSDYVNLLQKPRYAEAVAAGDSIEDFARGLQQAGYATDPVYAEKIIAIVDREELSAAFGGGNS
ncbi:flagellar assembly peptidoglycan hydrolase FlgJ [Gilvimarinus agarilyticus]|uniref:flagellar assembly peptidoglycan hydrolase FlgJ n=1 Tax=unclassified Gilvimarinus TaxID=2642066 RepID=UPI001C0A369C|nr:MULTISPECIES: flagellar assembly peptidoglycan hydrolase FlgJ [unclassified Gilvimarinus]MBU2887252.1 flagellar assembly peptidoglycan hydrolase FlgJ [Gilvimarinus agarilyticus]MDO6571911.1 flagellar assembly peptidoglycan hydrolase FlgJ [Gilvimarinus sp. 2_MG-2023]MDO6745980.1 flagellar assembly peptidoglycan hydrolase FlgJ [Gilvimarinus sp. 1_MG-2023]